MSKLSSIEKLERAGSAKRALSSSEAPVPQASSHMLSSKSSLTSQLKSAADEEAFHGLDETQKPDFAHRILIALACVIVLATLCYVLNYWFHFV